MPAGSSTRPSLTTRIRTALFASLGGECAECGSTDRLEIDHPWGRSWSPRRLSSYNRNLRYRREAAEGTVRLLCHECNQRIRPWRAAAAPATLAPDPF